MVQSQPNWLGQTIGGRYHIDAWLDQGGMSTVYKATDPNLKRPVAIKVIHPHLSRDPEFVRRFEQEASAVAQLRHSNIVQVYDFDHDGEVYYMVLEFVPGETLKTRLASLNKAGQSLSLAAAIQIMVPVARAVAYAHRQGMVHRDLKPANVMLSPQGQPILMDFGVARMLGETQHTMTGAIIGTALYMSPEQARGERADERADIYSMGVMLFEMVTGQPPFEADSAISILMKHATQPVPDIRELNRDIPDALVAVVEKALAKHPSDRFQTAEQFAEALQAVEVATDVSPVDHTTLRALRPATPSQVLPSQGVPPAPAQPAPVVAATPTNRGKPLWLFGAVAVVLVVALGFVALFVVPGLSRPAVAVPQEAAADTAGEPAAVAVEPEPALSEETEPAPTPEPVAVAEVVEEESLLPLSEGMVSIKAGTYTIGLAEADSNHAPSQAVDLAEFWLDEREVTNADYFHFLADSNFQPPATWENGNIPAGQEQFPIKGVTWDMADAYCTWARKRLPTEAEWEVAARGQDGRLFPWGDDERAVQLPRIGTYEVGSITPNLSPFGAYDMAGNVWEWVGEPYAPIQDGQRVLRGGGGGFVQDMAYRLAGDPNVASMVATAGIRCAASQVKEVEPDHALAHDDTNVLSFDDFTDPGSGWPSIAEGNYVFDYHPPEDYHLEVAAPEDHLAVTREQQYQDVTIETMAHLAKSDTETGDYRYGLVARRSGDDYYAFTVSPRTKRWFVLKRSAEGLEVLAEGEDASIQGKEEARDRLRVDAVGPNLVFHINDRVVAQINDTSYASGEVGFYDETFDETMAHIHFDSLTIRQAELPEAAANVLSFDDFTDPGSGWPSIAEGNYVFDYHPPEDYHLEVAAPEDHLAVTREQQYQDVTIETMAHLAKSDTETGDYRYGLVARRSGDDYYAFTVSPRTKRWHVLKRSAEGLEVLAEGEDASIQGKEEARDRLRVDAVGPNLVFHINDRVVAQINDTSYASGEVGFYDETFDETMAHIHFDSLTIRQAEDLVIAAVPTATPVPPTAEAIPATETPAPTATPAPPAAPTPAPVPPGMAQIPAGYFMMGSASGPGNEQPEHPVLLDSFLLDQFEVTNRLYRQCLNDGGCTQTGFPDGFTRPGYRDDPAFDNYPVVGVTWDQAAAYCRWAGKRLPTEAEWEYAAGGPDNLTWPWGNTFDPGLSAAGAQDTQPVGSFPAGASPFGIFDMAGNVAEWVVDAYSESFYASSPASSPVNSSGGAERVFRGGSFANPDGAFYTTSRRYSNSPAVTDVDVGFRCAQNAPAQPGPAQREALVAEFCQVFAGVKPGAACP